MLTYALSVGGLSQSPITPAVKMVAAKAAKNLLNKVPLITGALCDDVQLLEIIDVQTQVYRIHMKACVFVSPFVLYELVYRNDQKITHTSKNVWWQRWE